MRSPTVSFSAPPIPHSICFSSPARSLRLVKCHQLVTEACLSWASLGRGGLILPHSSLPGSSPTLPSEAWSLLYSLCLYLLLNPLLSRERAISSDNLNSCKEVHLRHTGLVSSCLTLILVMVTILDQLQFIEQLTTRWPHSTYLDREPPQTPSRTYHNCLLCTDVETKAQGAQ